MRYGFPVWMLPRAIALGWEPNRLINSHSSAFRTATSPEGGAIAVNRSARQSRLSQVRFQPRPGVPTLGAIALLLPLVGCGFSFKADIQNGNLVVNSGYEISETLLNQSPISFKGDPASFVETIDRFEIQEGQVRAFGKFVCPDKRLEPGSLDFVLQASSRQLLEAKIARVDSPCITLADPRIITVNQLLADSFQRLAAGTREIEVTQVKVGDQKIAIDFQWVTPLESPSPAASPAAPDRPANSPSTPNNPAPSDSLPNNSLPNNQPGTDI